MFEWTSLDHVALRGLLLARRAAARPPWPFDFFHLNSINLDPDGTLLVSSRNTWAADDIDPATGQLRLDARRQELELHAKAAARRPPSSTMPARSAPTLHVFDNGASPQIHAQSRGVVLDVDPATDSVSVLSQFLHPGHRCSPTARVTCRRCPNGDWFVGWGAQPDFSRVQRRAARCCSTRACPPATSPTARCASPGTGTPAERAGARGRAAPRRPRGRLRELERRDRRWRAGSCSRAPSRPARARRLGRPHGLRDRDPARRGRAPRAALRRGARARRRRRGRSALGGASRSRARPLALELEPRRVLLAAATNAAVARRSVNSRARRRRRRRRRSARRRAPRRS